VCLSGGRRLNWYNATNNAGWPPRYEHAAVVFQNKIWVLGGWTEEGYKNDVWYSSDGVNWTQATPSAGWSKRRSSQVVVFNNKMWLLGGLESGDINRNDVWSSTDGINWNLEVTNAEWPPISQHAAVVFDNKIWILGGALNMYGDGSNEVWYSADGKNWAKATNAEWSGRWAHSAVSSSFFTLLPPFVKEGWGGFYLTFSSAGRVFHLPPVSPLLIKRGKIKDAREGWDGFFISPL